MEVSPVAKENESNPESPRFRRKLMIGAALAVIIVFVVMMFLAGRPDPQRGESLPNAAPEATDGMAR